MVILKDKNYGRGDISGVGRVDDARGEGGKEMDETEEKCQKWGTVRGISAHQECVLWLALLHQKVSQDNR